MLAHQADRDLCGWLPDGGRLADLATVPTLDLRGYGDSEDGPDGATERRDLDVVAAAAELRRRDAEGVVQFVDDARAVAEATGAHTDLTVSRPAATAGTCWRTARPRTRRSTAW